MVNFIEASYALIERHGPAVRAFAIHEANGQIFKLGVQVGRLRTLEEQKQFLNDAYRKTLSALQTLDDGPFSLTYHISQLLPYNHSTVSEAAGVAQQYLHIFGESDALGTMDFGEVLQYELAAIPKDSLAFELLEVYKSYVIHECYLEKVIESLNLAEAAQNDKKVVLADLGMPAKQEDLKEVFGAMIQQALQPLYEREVTLPDKPYLNVSEAAKYLNLAKQTLYGLTSRRAIPFVKPAKHILFLKADLDSWVEQGRKSSHEELKQKVGGIRKH